VCRPEKPRSVQQKQQQKQKGGTVFAALVVISALGALSLVGAVSTLRVTSRDDYRRIPTSA
jgi:hypothetical protein